MEKDIYKTLVKDIIKRKMKEHIKYTSQIKDPNKKYECPLCGGSFIRQKKSVHEKTNKHQNIVKRIKNNCKKIINDFN
jgi:rRNA maturation endonuclease Nob1